MYLSGTFILYTPTYAYTQNKTPVEFTSVSEINISKKSRILDFLRMCSGWKKRTLAGISGH